MKLKNRYLYRSHISEKKFREILRWFCEDLDATKTASFSHVQRKSVNQLFTKIRTRILFLCQKEEKFSGEVEVDESYFGARRVRGKRGRGAQRKTPVVGLLKQGGKVFTKVIPNCTRKELIPIIKGQIVKKSTVYTDGWKSYDGLVLNGYHHYRIFQHENEFARGRNHVNGIESFWSFTKGRLSKFNGVKKEYFV
ncbi:MAG: IS1595 family transposase, partial [Candidatus Levybacteria bacterium CG10_big_fil_rev_8_21_14_0_10_36_7]